MSKQVESLAQSSDGMPSVTSIAGDAIKDLAREAWSLKGPLGTIALVRDPVKNIVDPLKALGSAARHPVETLKGLPENVMAKFTDGRQLLAGWVQEHAPTVVNDAGGAAETVVRDAGGAAEAAAPAVEGAAKVVVGAAKVAGPVVGDVAEGLEALI